MEPEAATGQAESAPRPGHGDGFEDFWVEHYRDYCRMLMAIGASLVDAHNAISRLYVDMLEKHTWDGLSNPGAWVRVAVLHTYYDQQKRQRRGRELEIKNHHLTPESYLDDGLNVWEDLQWVEQMLSTLPPAQRAVIELVIDGLSRREIADLLGKTPETIRQHLAHARKRLKANLGKDCQIGPASWLASTPREEGTP